MSLKLPTTVREIAPVDCHPRALDLLDAHGALVAEFHPSLEDSAASKIATAVNHYDELVCTLSRMVTGVTQTSSQNCEYYEGLEGDALREAILLLHKLRTQTT